MLIEKLSDNDRDKNGISLCQFQKSEFNNTQSIKYTKMSIECNTKNVSVNECSTC